MKLHYKGKYDLNPDSLPHQPHKPNAVPFKEAKDTKTMAMICNIAAFLLLIPLLIILFFRCGRNGLINLFWGRSFQCLCLFPHEFYMLSALRKMCIYIQISNKACFL